MDANAVYWYLRGLIENTEGPLPHTAWETIRAVVLSAHPVDAVAVQPVTMTVAGTSLKSDCAPCRGQVNSGSGG